MEAGNTKKKKVPGQVVQHEFLGSVGDDRNDIDEHGETVKEGQRNQTALQTLFAIDDEPMNDHEDEHGHETAGQRRHEPRHHDLAELCPLNSVKPFAHQMKAKHGTDDAVRTRNRKLQEGGDQIAQSASNQSGQVTVHEQCFLTVVVAHVEHSFSNGVRHLIANQNGTEHFEYGGQHARLSKCQNFRTDRSAETVRHIVGSYTECQKEGNHKSGHHHVK